MLSNPEEEERLQRTRYSDLDNRLQLMKGGPLK